MRKITIYKSLGRFNFANQSEQSWQVVMCIDDGPTVSELWDLDDEPCIDGEPPSQVVEMISQRLEKYWIKTSRDKDREKIKWIREHSAELDRDWALQEMCRLQAKSARIYKDIQNLQDYLEV